MARSTSDPAEHLDNITLTEPQAGETHAPAPVVQDAPSDQEGDQAPDAAPVMDGPQLMPRPEFIAGFVHAWSIPGTLRPEFAALAVAPDDRPAAEMAGGALYDLLSEHFPRLLHPNSPTITNLLILLPFLFAKVQAVRLVLSAPQAPQEAQGEAKAARPPANVSKAPPGPSGSPVGWMGT